VALVRSPLQERPSSARHLWATAPVLSVRCRTEAADLDLSLMSGGGTRGPLLDSRVREQAIGFSLDHRVALATQPFQRGSVQDRNVRRLSMTKSATLPNGVRNFRHRALVHAC
jgi:hypothetical protein